MWRGNMARIEVICGPMYSGKSEELMRLIRRANIAERKTLVVKPSIDDRYSDSEVVSHNGVRMVAQRWNLSDNNISEALDIAFKYDVIGFDEAQFFSPVIVKIVLAIQAAGHDTIIAGLDMDYKREPFGSMDRLLAYATSVTKLTAICHSCGKDAPYTYRLPGKNTGETIQVGGLDEYEARCWDCHAY
jgi:thymidine kinase